MGVWVYESRRGKIGDAPTRVYPCVSCMGSKGKMSYLYYKPPFTLSQPTASCNIRRNIIFNSQPIINTPSEVNSSPEPASPVPSVTVEYGSSQACPISFDDPVEELPSDTNTQRTCDTEVSSLDDTISEYSTNESDSDLDISEDATVSCESSPVRPNKAVAVTNDSSFHGFDLSSEATLIANRALPFLPLRVTKKKSDYSYVASLVDKHRNFTMDILEEYVNTDKAPESYARLGIPFPPLQQKIMKLIDNNWNPLHVIGGVPEVPWLVVGLDGIGSSYFNFEVTVDNSNTLDGVTSRRLFFYGIKLYNWLKYYKSDKEMKKDLLIIRDYDLATFVIKALSVDKKTIMNGLTPTVTSLYNFIFQKNKVISPPVYLTRIGADKLRFWFNDLVEHLTINQYDPYLFIVGNGEKIKAPIFWETNNSSKINQIREYFISNKDEYSKLDVTKSHGDNFIFDCINLNESTWSFMYKSEVDCMLRSYMDTNSKKVYPKAPIPIYIFLLICLAFFHKSEISDTIENRYSELPKFQCFSHWLRVMQSVNVQVTPFHQVSLYVCIGGHYWGAAKLAESKENELST